MQGGARAVDDVGRLNVKWSCKVIACGREVVVWSDQITTSCGVKWSCLRSDKHALLSLQGGALLTCDDTREALRLLESDEVLT